MRQIISTYSIIARDALTGQFGIGVQSHWFAAGSIVPWAEQGVGAVATQADANIDYGRLGLTLMAAGMSAEQALAAMVASDPESETRQVAMIDREGRVAAHTGTRCIAYAGHLVGEGYSVQGNLLKNPAEDILSSMADAYSAAQGDFSERLLQALEAAQDAGGDVRGKQSAGLLVVPDPDDPIGRPYVTDLRVDDSDQPLVDLRRLLTVQRSYEWHSQAIHAVSNGDMETARKHYGKLRKLVVGTREPQFWYATALAEAGHLDEALPIFAEVFMVEPAWREIIDRLVAAGVFPADEEVVAQVKGLGQG